jgi:hypothetical protein
MPKSIQPGDKFRPLRVAVLRPKLSFFPSLRNVRVLRIRKRQMRKTGQIRKNYCASFWLRSDQLFEIHYRFVWQQGLQQFPPGRARAATPPHRPIDSHTMSAARCSETLALQKHLAQPQLILLEGLRGLNPRAHSLQQPLCRLGTERQHSQQGFVFTGSVSKLPRTVRGLPTPSAQRSGIGHPEPMAVLPRHITQPFQRLALAAGGLVPRLAGSVPTFYTRIPKGINSWDRPGTDAI